MRRRRGAPFALALALATGVPGLVACGSAASPAGAPARSVGPSATASAHASGPASSASAGASSGVSAAGSAAGSAAASGRASGSASPSPAPSLDSLPGDIDGDGRPDRLALRTVGATVVLVAHLTRWGRETLPLGPVAAGGPAAAIVGDAAVAADGTRVVFVQIGSGAAVSVLDVVALVNGHLIVVRSGGAPFQLAVGGTLGSDDDFGCPPPPSRGLVVLSVSSEQSAGGSATGTLDYYRVTGGIAVLTRSRAVSAPSVAAAVARYRSVTNRCGLTAPGS